MNDDYHTGIRTVDDILSFKESLNDTDYEGWETDGFAPNKGAVSLEDVAREVFDNRRNH